MDHSLHPNALRLVGDNPADAAVREVDAQRLAVEDENRAASSLPVGDATRLFAMQVSESLEGGKSAILTPSNRHRLLRLGQRLGVRDFDANLVIAIVQDGARRGESIQTDLTRDRLRLVSATGAKREHASMVRMIVVAGAIAIGAVIGLVAWITSA
jgi:hypothetical protein